MTAIALIEATVLRRPVCRTGNRGRNYAMTTVVVGRGEEAEFWRVLAFGANVQEFLALRNGDAISVTGPMRTELKGPPNAPTGVLLSVIAERVTLLTGVEADGGQP